MFDVINSLYQEISTLIFFTNYKSFPFNGEVDAFIIIDRLYQEDCVTAGNLNKVRQLESHRSSRPKYFDTGLPRDIESINYPLRSDVPIIIALIVMNISKP